MSTGDSMIISVLVAVILTATSPQRPGAPQDLDRMVGWHDELVTASRWTPLNLDNKANVKLEERGCLKLSLDHVPANWPWTFQWSGLSQDAHVDIARFPVLMAHVVQVHGYAHMDIEVLDAHGKSIRTLRTSTVNNPGMSTIDFSGVLDPAVYSLRLSLIVGGDNSGCSATYHWVRFAATADAEFFSAHPNFNRVYSPGDGSLRRRDMRDEGLPAPDGVNPESRRPFSPR